MIHHVAGPTRCGEESIGASGQRQVSGMVIAAVRNCPWLEGRSARGCRAAGWRGAVGVGDGGGKSALRWVDSEVVGPAMRGAGGGEPPASRADRPRRRG